jgi:transcriptional regulator with XRE-family HTH domain
MKDITFATRFRALLKHRRISVDEVSAALELNRQQVYTWVSGKHNPSLLNAIAIARLLNVSLDYLAGLSEREN